MKVTCYLSPLPPTHEERSVPTLSFQYETRWSPESVTKREIPDLARNQTTNSYLCRPNPNHYIPTNLTLLHIKGNQITVQMYVLYVSTFTTFRRKSSKLFTLNIYFTSCMIIFKYDVFNKAVGNSDYRTLNGRIVTECIAGSVLERKKFLYS
jgi:secreted Zn-dependent insulinase-like peptidase